MPTHSGKTKAAHEYVDDGERSVELPGRDKLRRLEQKILRRIAENEGQEVILKELCKEVETMLEDACCSVSLFSDDGKRIVASVPSEARYLSGPMQEEGGNATPGEAVYIDEVVIVDDVARSPLWREYLDYAGTHNIRAAWSVPLRAGDGDRLGSFNVSLGRTGSPGRTETELLKIAACLAGLTIDHGRAWRLLQRYEEMVRYSRDMMAYIDTDYIYRGVSDSYVAYFGLTREEVIGGHVRSFFDEGVSLSLVKDNLDRTLNGEAVDWQGWVEQPDQPPVHMTAYYDPIYAGDKVIGIVVVIRDTTESQRIQQALRVSEKRFRNLFDDSPSMFFTVDSEGVITSINQFGADHLGYARERMVGGNILEYADEKDRALFENQLADCVSREGAIRHCEFRICHKHGSRIWLRAAMRMIAWGESREILVSGEDVTETRILSERLEYQARHDSLTGLVNRAEFERRLRRILTSRSSGKEHALCFLDMDQFKVINDTCGHLAGDELLRRVSHALGTVVRKRDTVARLGGDEFAVLLEHCPLEQAQRVAANLLEAVQSLQFSWDAKSFNVGITIGMVPINESSGTVVDVLSAADAACYAAKDAGRNRVHVYHQNDMEMARRRTEMSWVSEINQALEEGRLRLARQPIVPLDDNVESGGHYEILLRMQAKNGDIIYPGSFLAAAERYNLATKLDRWVITTVFSWLKASPRELDSLILCAINLSGHSLGDPDFLRFLLEQLQLDGIEAEKFCFEITETAAISNLGDALKFIATLEGIGCSFSLDDFGAGLSSFNYLKNLPVDYLKIDGAFIRDIIRDPIDAAMVRSINDIGHVMGKKTIAEFVENDEILQVLRAIGVDYAQGFGLGRPRLLNLDD